MVNALRMTNNFVGFLVKNYQQFGSIFRVKVPNQSFTILAGPEGNIFMSQVGDNYLTLSGIWKSYSQEYGTDIFISRMEGSAHRHLRQIMNRGYSREAILPYLPLLVETTEQMMCQWQSFQFAGYSVERG